MSEAAPQLPPAEQGPEQGYSIYHQIQQEREAAEQARLADEQQQQEIARHQQITEDQARAEGAGLPFMHPDKRSALEATANAASVDDLPEMVSDADRRSATRGFHTSHLDASAALNKIKEGARTELEEFDAKRQHAEHMEIQGERHRAGRNARRSATEELEGTFEDRFNAAMESHKNLGEGAKAMLATNLREQMKREDAEHAQRVGVKAGQARVNYIEDRGGAEALRDIRDEESLAARVAEEADKLEEKRAWQERMGVGEPRGAKQEGRDSVRISESASEELVRPDGVSGKDWISMNAQQKRAAMAEAETDAARVQARVQNIRDLRAKVDAQREANYGTPEQAAEMAKHISELSDEAFAKYYDEFYSNLSPEEYDELAEEVRSTVNHRYHNSGLASKNAEPEEEPDYDTEPEYDSAPKDADDPRGVRVQRIAPYTPSQVRPLPGATGRYGLSPDEAPVFNPDNDNSDPGMPEARYDHLDHLYANLYDRLQGMSDEDRESVLGRMQGGRELYEEYEAERKHQEEQERRAAAAVAAAPPRPGFTPGGPEANAPGSSLPSAARAAARISLLGATTPVNPGQARTTIVAPAPPQAPVDPRAPVRRMVTDGWRMGNWGEHFADTWLGRTIGYTPRAERERQKRQAEREARQSPAPTPENHSLQSDRNDIYEDYNRGLISEEERDRRINEL